MKTFLGIDYGTSSVKALIWDVERSRVLGVGAQEVLYRLKDGVRAEQDPSQVLKATLQAIRMALSGAKVSGKNIEGISFSGQMHGTVIVDQMGQAQSPIITWEDSRFYTEDLKRIAKRAPDLIAKSGCGLSKGFMGATMWSLLKEKSSILSKGHTLLLPGDWLRCALSETPHLVTDPSNGSSTGLFDTKKRTWNREACKALGLSPSLLPEVRETTELAGVLSEKAGRETGLKPGTPLYVGGGDQPLSMIGSGIAHQEDLSLLNVGTGSQVARWSPVFKKSGPLIVFCFPGRGFSLLGAGLSGGAALRWLRDVSLQATELLSNGRITPSVYEHFSKAAETVHPGSDGLLFIPYLSGARHKPSSTASFQGLQAHHTFAHMARAVMEGVVWELKFYADHFPKRKAGSTGLVIAGGGMSSRVWSSIAASIFNGPARRGACQEQASLGAALIAAVGAGAYRDIAAAAAKAPMEAEVVPPEHKKEYYRIAQSISWEEF